MQKMEQDQKQQRDMLVSLYENHMAVAAKAKAKAKAKCKMDEVLVSIQVKTLAANAGAAIERMEFLLNHKAEQELKVCLEMLKDTGEENMADMQEKYDTFLKEHTALKKLLRLEVDRLAKTWVQEGLPMKTAEELKDFQKAMKEYVTSYSKTEGNTYWKLKCLVTTICSWSKSLDIAIKKLNKSKTTNAAKAKAVQDDAEEEIEICRDCQEQGDVHDSGWNDRHGIAWTNTDFYCEDTPWHLYVQGKDRQAHALADIQKLEYYTAQKGWVEGMMSASSLYTASAKIVREAVKAKLTAWLKICCTADFAPQTFGDHLIDALLDIEFFQSAEELLIMEAFFFYTMGVALGSCSCFSLTDV